MNVRDSEALLGLLLEEGFCPVDKPETADVILINTCSVRDHAEHRAISFAGALKKLTTKTRNSKLATRISTPDTQNPIIGIIGCMARNRGKELFKKFKHVNLICAPGSISKIPYYLERILAERIRVLDVDDKERGEDLYTASYRTEPDHAQIVISTGCSNYCAYCIVPHVRGGLRLRKPDDILNEVKRNVEQGVTKITLLGQNVNDYVYRVQGLGFRVQGAEEEDLDRVQGLGFRVQGAEEDLDRVQGIGDGVQGKDASIEKECISKNIKGSSPKNLISFVDLLKMVEAVEGVQEITFVSANPRNTSDDLLEFMGNSKKVKRHLHIPFQSGSNRILGLMNRGYTKEDYLTVIDKYKRIVGGTLSADVIVGYPTETEEDFLETKDVLTKVQFKYAYIFKYSPRKGTKAAGLSDDVGKEVKERRHADLLDLQKTVSRNDAERV
ncbi:MAG: radical SAM protein [Candidatus Omnitrophica bacterium]|nr:radical SAM protein [Candidatus Omnitrophota bacterium]